MNNRFIALVSVFLFSLVQCKEILKNEDNKALPLPGKHSNKQDSHKKPDERGWNHWPQWPQEQSNDWSDNNWPKEPGKLPNWGNHGGADAEKPCCGKNGWGLPNIQSDPWHDESRPDPLPSSHSEPEPEHEPWMPPDNNVDSNQDDNDWHIPNWKPQPEKKPCECDKRGLNSYEPSPAQHLNFPDLPSGIRPNKNNWEPWNDLEKKLKDSIKATAGAKDQVESKSVNSQESSKSQVETESNVEKAAENPALRLLRKRI